MPRANPALSLAEWYVISLRPLGQHAGVRRAAAALGARTFALSTLSIELLAARAELKAALACRIVVVTSPNAARQAAALASLKTRRGQRWYAVGPGTAAALRRVGVADVAGPASGTNSEALLALPALADLSDRTVGVITAPGGRSHLALALAARGARVRLAEVYRRQPLTPSPFRLDGLAALPRRSALLVSSGEALANLWQVLEERIRARLRSRACVVSSERLRERARALGFRHCLLAVDAQPASLLAALASHARSPRFR